MFATNLFGKFSHTSDNHFLLRPKYCQNGGTQNVLRGYADMFYFMILTYLRCDVYIHNQVVWQTPSRSQTLYNYTSHQQFYERHLPLVWHNLWQCVTDKGHWNEVYFIEIVAGRYKYRVFVIWKVYVIQLGCVCAGLKEFACSTFSDT